MSNSPDTEIVDGITFELRPHHRNPTNKDWVCLRKNRNFTNRYLALAEEFKHCRMVEVGVDQGGGTSFFTKLFQPEALLAIELSNKPVAAVTKFLARHDPDAKVSIHWGIDQSDRVEVPRLVASVFHDQPLDLVVDDASHLLVPTTATFEMLFPRTPSRGVVCDRRLVLRPPAGAELRDCDNSRPRWQSRQNNGGGHRSKSQWPSSRNQ